MVGSLALSASVDTPALAASAPATGLPEAERQTAIEAAQELYAAGLNVLPQPIGAKYGYAWTPLLQDLARAR